MISEESNRRITVIENELKDLQESMYGSKQTLGLFTRLRISETRLEIFWWVLAVIGTSSIALLIEALFNGIRKI